jgi:HK97 family phage prohead protease
MATQYRANRPAVERRMFALLELRVEPDAADQVPHIRGYAAVFDTLSEPLFEWDEGELREQVARGAFAKTIAEADVRALVNHDPNYVLGRNRAGTLALSEDMRGLAVDIVPPDTQWARDLMTSMKRGDVNQMSFSFRPVKYARSTEKDAVTGRRLETITLQEVRLYDVSVVTIPAYPATSVDVRSLYGIDIPEPGQAAHSGNGTPPTEPVQVDHSVLTRTISERERHLALLRGSF